jgi:hypothetical protein
MVALAAVSADCLALRASLAAMDCCLKARHACGGMRTADDCCQSMGRGIGPTTSTGPVMRAHVTRSDVAIVTTIEVPAARVTSVAHPDPIFTRPHDPPHLHPVPLRI